MLDIGEHGHGRLIQLEVIVRVQGIPFKYLERIFFALKKVGYFNGDRGWISEYMPARPPDGMTEEEFPVLLDRRLEIAARVDFPAHCKRA